MPFLRARKGADPGGYEGYDVEVEWMPFELRPFSTPTLRPEDEYLPRVWARSVYPMAQRLGVDIRLPSISPQPYTRLAFEGCQQARVHDRGTEYTDRVLRAFFQKDRDIGDVAELTRTAGEAGLDAEAFRQAIETGVHAPRHQAAVRLASDLEIASMPTVIVNDLNRLVGVPGPEALRELIDAAERESQPGS